MKILVYALMIGWVCVGCSRHVYHEPYPDILEAEKQQVAHCTLLGVISETADAANPWSLAAEENMRLKVRERAGQIGATHILWLHKTDNMATAQAFQCP